MTLYQGQEKEGEMAITGGLTVMKVDGDDL